MDFTGVIAKINPFFIIFTEIYLYFEAEKVPLFHKNLIRACGPLGHPRGGAFWFRLCFHIMSLDFLHCFMFEKILIWAHYNLVMPIIESN
jgi:hypothetical protein